MGRRGVVTSAHPLATMAGVEMLFAGGNAVDAAVATAAALNVVEPYMSGMGGIGVMVVRVAGGGVRVLTFVGRVPVAADPDRATRTDLTGGPRACLVPGNVGGWLEVHERHGRMSRAEVFGPATRLARDGFPLTWKNCDFIARASKTLEYSDEASRLYRGGRVSPGEVLTQPELAVTFQQIIEGGREAFYRGPVGRAICAAVQAAGGWLSDDDLASFAPEWLEPLTMSLGEHEIATVPPPFAAFQALQTLSILERDELEQWGHNSADYLHHFIEAVKLASADRIAHAWADEVPSRGLTSKAYARAQRGRIDAAQAAVSEGERWSRERLPGQILPGHPATFDKEHTTHFACADADGNVVTVTQTLGSPFGSGFAVAGTGLILNNLLEWQDVDPGSPNRLQPGRRVGTNMSPMQIARGGLFSMSIGTPGSFGILQTTPQMILNALRFGMNIQEAIEAPRVRVYRDRLVDVEARVPVGVRDELSRRGHRVNVIDDWSWIVGGGQGIVRDPESGSWQGGADPRRDGYAVAW